MKLFRKRLFLVLFFTLLMELSLQLVSLIADLGLRGKINKEYASQREGGITILCIGDSFTYGVGAGYSLSYPVQLQKIISDKFPLLNAKVINHGWPGTNSSTLARNLGQYLQKFKSDIALVCVGRNDDWNMENVDFSLLHSEGAMKKDIIIAKLDNILIHVRLYKLFKYWFSRTQEPTYDTEDYPASESQKINTYADDKTKDGLSSILDAIREDVQENKFAEAAKTMASVHEAVLRTKNAPLISSAGFLYLDLEESSKAVKLFDRALSYNSNLINAYHGRGEAYFRLGEDSLALENFNRAINLCTPDYPTRSWLYRRVGAIYINLGDKEKGIENIKKAFECDGDMRSTVLFLKNCFDSDTESEKLFSSIEEMVSKNNFSLDAKSYQQYIGYLKKGGGKFSSASLKKLIDAIIKNSLVRIFLDGQKYGTKLYYVNYPSCRYPPDGTAEEFVNTFWPGRLINVQEAFLSFWESKEKKDYFVPDNHCTAKGYKLMAKIILNSIEKDLSSYLKK